MTFVINPNVAFRLTESWSLAVGADYIMAEVNDFSREVPVNLDANPRTFEVIGFSNLSRRRRRPRLERRASRTARTILRSA